MRYEDWIQGINQESVRMFGETLSEIGMPAAELREYFEDGLEFKDALDAIRQAAAERAAGWPND